MTVGFFSSYIAEAQRASSLSLPSKSFHQNNFFPKKTFYDREAWTTLKKYRVADHKLTLVCIVFIIQTPV